MAVLKLDSFYVAAFSCNGEMLGLGERKYNEFSPGLREQCAMMLKRYGSVFTTSLKQYVPGAELQFTSQSGSALITVYFDGKPEISGVFASGREPSVDSEVLRLFHLSICRTQIIKPFLDQNPFGEIITLLERPLLGIVCWVSTSATDEYLGIMRELVLHLAVVFFQSENAM